MSALLVATLAGCATPRPTSIGDQAPPGVTVDATDADEPVGTPAPTAAPNATEGTSDRTGAETADELFAHVAGILTVNGTEFHQIRYTPAAEGQPATLIFGTAQWEAQLADNTLPIGPIVVVSASSMSRAEIVERSGAAPSAARSASTDPYTPVEPGSESPSGEEQRLVALPAPTGDGSLVIATTGVDDAAARAFAEAVTR